MRQPQQVRRGAAPWSRAPERPLRHAAHPGQAPARPRQPPAAHVAANLAERRAPGGAADAGRPRRGKKRKKRAPFWAVQSGVTVSARAAKGRGAPPTRVSTRQCVRFFEPLARPGRLDRLSIPGLRRPCSLTLTFTNSSCYWPGLDRSLDVMYILVSVALFYTMTNAQLWDLPGDVLAAPASALCGWKGVNSLQC